MTKAIAVFNSNHDALETEKALKQYKIPVRPIIKPRKITSSCALALEFDLKFHQKVIEICAANKLSLAGMFRKKNQKWDKI